MTVSNTQYPALPVNITITGVASEATLQDIKNNTAPGELVAGGFIDLALSPILDSAYATLYVAAGGEKKFNLKNDSGYSFYLGIDGVQKGAIEKGFNGEGLLDIVLTLGQTVGLKVFGTGPTSSGQIGFNFFK